MSLYKPDCRKFHANIFHKSKCTNCFKPREEHSNDALDSNRASRMVSKCGYLFVAPDWDFTIPLYRTKRWQRRWFVLFDDGELTYSVDDLPATIPQGVIDMNRVLEVSTAEDVTGNQFSLAITAPDRVTFIKGTCREESQWWMDVLSVFPRKHKHGRHKRNATFPGIKGTSSSSSSASAAVAAVTAAATAGASHQIGRTGDQKRVPNTLESPVSQRVRFHSITSDLRVGRRPSSAPSLDSDPRIFSATHKPYTNTAANNAHNCDGGNESTKDTTYALTTDTPSVRTSQSDAIEYLDNTTKNINEKNSIYSRNNRDSSLGDSYSNYGYSKNDNSSSSTITPYQSCTSLQYSRSTPIPTPSAPLTPTHHSTPLTSSTRHLRGEHKENTPPYTPEYRDNPPTSESPPTQDKHTHRLRTRRALNREARALSQPRSELQSCSVLADLEATKKREEKLKDIAASITTTSSKRRQHLMRTGNQQSSCAVVDKPTRDRDTDDIELNDDPTDTPPPTQVRGAPDGCGGADDTTQNTLQRVDLPAEDLLYIKKGWLLKAGDNQGWNKYWFVLHGTGLRFYRNSDAEDSGILDGIIDLGTAKDIHNLDVARNYGFVIKTWSDKQYVFSAVTAGIRHNWVQALRNAANFSTTEDDSLHKEGFVKSATIESIAAERDTNKSISAYNNKNASLSNISSNTIANNNSTNLGDKTRITSSGLHRSNSPLVTDSNKLHYEIGSKMSSSQHSLSAADSPAPPRTALSSDEEYKTASEASAASNLSNDNVEFFDWDGSRSRNNSGHSNNNSRRSRSSPPNSRRGTTGSFPNLDNSYGLNKNILDRYKSMQSHTKSNYSNITKTGAVCDDEVDYSKIMLDAKQCDDSSICAKISQYVDKSGSGFCMSDSMKSLDLDASLHHDKVSSSGTLASGTGEALLVDLLETQVETLKAKLEATQGFTRSSSQETLSANSENEMLSVPPVQLNSAQDEIIRLQNKLEETRNDLEETQHHLQEAHENTATIEGDYEKLSQQLHLCQEQVTNAQNTLKLEQDKTVQAEEERNAATKEKLFLFEQIETMNDKVKSLQTEVGQLVESVSAKEHQVAEQHAVIAALRHQHECEKAAWRVRADAGTDSQELARIKSSLDASEQQVAALTSQLTACGRQQSLARQLSDSQSEVCQLKETLKSEKSEVYKWKDLVKELRSLLDGRNVDMDRKREEIRLTREAVRVCHQDHEVTKDRLQRGIEENEALSAKAREMQRQLNSAHDKRTSSTPSMYSSKEKFSSRRQLPRLDSFSDLSNVDFSIDPELLDKETLTDEFYDIRSRFERSISEMVALRRELRESECAHDALQLAHSRLGQDSAKQGKDFDAQQLFMADRVQDLTNKLSISEKQVRTLKTKVTRAESKDRRRTHSLKGRDSFGLGKDVDQKLAQLEAKMSQLMPSIETAVEEANASATCGEETKASEDAGCSTASTPTSTKHVRNTKRSKSFDDPTKADRMRRKSLESSANDGVKAALRINNLEAKVAALLPRQTGAPTESNLSSPLVTRRSKTRGGSGKQRQSIDADIRTQSDMAPADALEVVCFQLCECMELLETQRCTCGSSEQSILQQRLASTQHLAAGAAHFSPAVVSPQTLRVMPVAQQIVKLLQQKLSAIAERRLNLKANNAWTKEAQQKNFAERLAYETVLLSQVSQALRLSNHSNSNLDSIKLQDLMESHRKMAFLEKKLTNPEIDLDTMAPLDFYTRMLAEKLVITGEVLSSVSQDGIKSTNDKVDATCRDLQGRLLERERHLAQLVTSYKEEKLHEVAVVMVQDVNKSVPQDDFVLMEEVRIREAWSTAQHLLVQEIVNHQNSQSLLRISHLLNPSSEVSSSLSIKSSLSLTLCSAEAIDRLQTAAEESLRQEMEESVLTLSQKYEKVLSQYRSGDASLINSVSASMEEVLNEFAGVMAQKAIIDGHLALLQDEFDRGTIQTTQDSLLISEDNRDPMESVGDVLDSEAHLLMFLGGKDSSVESLVKPALSQAEFTYLFNKSTSDCNSDASLLLSQILAQREEVAEVPELMLLASSSSYRSSTRSLHQGSPITSDRDQDILEQPQLRAAASMSKILQSPKSRRRSETRKSRRSSDITGMLSLGCRQCEELRYEINKLKKKLLMQDTLVESRDCTNCPKLLDTIEKLEASHRANVSRVESGDSEDQLIELKQRLLLLEEGYEAQITQLKQQYEETLAAHPDSCDEAVRQKYQKEIEHLRGLCEKGLGTIESSQHKIMSDIKEKHKQELTLLQAEKDQALAEETQATLAALDAMRKAHEAEVQREVAKIKEQFIRKMQTGEDVSEMTHQHEHDMQDIRREILSLSEKYSVKCLESANLEAKIENINKHLSEANKNISELENRNSKLQIQVADKIETYKAEGTTRDAETELKIRTAEVAVRDDKLLRLGAQLHKSQTHEGEVLEVCRHLRHYLRSDRPLLPTDQLVAVTNRLEHLMITAPTALRESSEAANQQLPRQARPHLRRPKVLSSKELTRSPSCPRLGQYSRLSCPTDLDLQHSPLSGMVASRKKVFENTHGKLILANAKSSL